MEQGTAVGTAAWQTQKDALRQAMRQAQAEVAEAATDTDDEVDDVSDDADDVEVEDDVVVEVESDDDEAEEDDDDPDEDDEGDEDEVDVVEDQAPEREPKRQGRQRKGKKIARLYREIKELKQGNKQAIEDALAAREAAKERDAELQRERDKAEQRDREIAERVNRRMGDDREYAQLLAEITADEDTDPLNESPEIRTERNRKKARVRQIQDSRSAMTDLQAYAEQTVQERAGTLLRALAKKLPGVDPSILDRADFSNSIEHFHLAGRAVEAAARQDEIDALKKENETLKGQLSSAKTKKGTPLKRVAEGGASIAPQKMKKSDNPMENLREAGLVDKNGKITPEGREKIRSGRISRLV